MEGREGDCAAPVAWCCRTAVLLQASVALVLVALSEVGAEAGLAVQDWQQRGVSGWWAVGQ